MALSQRLAWYDKELADARARSRLPAWLLDFSPQQELFDQMQKIAGLYYDSFYGGRLQEIEEEVAALSKRLLNLQMSGQGALADDLIRELSRLKDHRRLKAVYKAHQYVATRKPSSK